MKTMKTATRATYGCSRKSVIVDLSCGLGYTPALSVTHSTAKVALQLVALYKYRAFFNANLHVTWLRWCSWHYHCLFYFFDSDSDSVRCLPPTCVLCTFLKSRQMLSLKWVFWFIALLFADSMVSVLPTFWVFPYFMEQRVTAALPSFLMLDYQVKMLNILALS